MCPGIRKHMLKVEGLVRRERQRQERTIVIGGGGGPAILRSGEIRETARLGKDSARSHRP